MKTRRLPCRTPQEAQASVAEAAELLAAGELVAFPTETVYGLGSNALDEEAVRRIYDAKGRPAHNPLIVHVATWADARRLAPGLGEHEARLARAFWPGPLTLVAPGEDSPVALALRGGGSTVALRQPDQPLALRLIEQCRFPLAAPSANRSNAISPTTADMVLASLDGRIAAVLDGGPCRVGIESTVVQLQPEGFAILRPGSITESHLARELGLPRIPPPTNGGTLASPGLLPRHYAPAKPLRLIHATEATRAGELLVIPGHDFQLERNQLLLPSDAAGYARFLYAALWEADSREEFTGIALVLPPQGPEWEAIHDRLRRAAAS